MMKDFSGDPLAGNHDPCILSNEEDLLQHANDIDLLVIASPNYLHTPTLLKWGVHDLTILVEKPVAVSKEQHDELMRISSSPQWRARLWVAMEYRYDKNNTATKCFNRA